MSSYPTEEFKWEVTFPTDESVRWREIANQNATSDIAFLKLENPRMSPEEEADTWRSLYTFHLQKLKGES